MEAPTAAYRPGSQRPRAGLRSALALLASALLGLVGSVPASAQVDAELAELLRDERQEAEGLRRAGETGAARRILGEHLADDPQDGEAHQLFALCRFDESRFDAAIEHAGEALVIAAEAQERGLFSAAARTLVSAHLELGDTRAALGVLDRAGGALDPRIDPRSAWVVSQLLFEVGRRDEAREALLAGAGAETGDWPRLLARARCEQRLGWFERASQSLVAAARSERVAHPDVLSDLGRLYFEVYREVENAVGNARSVGQQYREALAVNPVHLDAMLGEFELYRYNWRRRNRSAADLLEAILAAHPDAPRAQLAGASVSLDDGKLVQAREHLARLDALAPMRRDVRTEKATLAWVEHRRDEARAILAELAAVDPGDGRPEREMGRHLCELYRFAEAVPFLEASVERDPSDVAAWTQLGRALANSGLEERALEALVRAEHVAAGRKDAWRNNLKLALERMERLCQVEEAPGELTFVWRPDAADVLRGYLPEFYAEAREDLSQRYGYTPGPVRIEVFREHRDFSARSTGFEGFPATGVCFGPVVTALSPLSELRGSFSWARTSFHEFSHVVHLGLSHNRCPRWITEGLATWEERERNRSWTRNMRRDLLDARANDAIIPVRDLNRAFRGSRILFGYYQGGLLCEMLIDEHGFAPMVRLLEAFDRGFDLDEAFAEVYRTTPEEVDTRFLEFVDGKLAGLAIEPRWAPLSVASLRLSLSRRPPEDPVQRKRWQDDWTTVAWSAWQTRSRIDADHALRIIAKEEPTPREHFLRGSMAMTSGDEDGAVEHWSAGVDAGGTDFRVHSALGTIHASRGERERALEHFLAAERAFPGFPDGDLAAEKNLWRLYDQLEDEESAMAARERWLDWDASDLGTRLNVAGWLAGKERYAEAAERFREANEIDPFRRGLHRRWGRVLAELDRHEEAVREFRVALSVPAHLDSDVTKLRGGPVGRDEYEAALAAIAGRDLAGDERERAIEAELGLGEAQVEARSKERALLLGLRASSLLALERAGEARELAGLALEIDEDCEAAADVLERLN